MNEQSIYKGVIPLGAFHKPHIIVSTFASERYCESLSNLIKFTNCNVALVVDLNKKLVFIQVNNTTVSAASIASKLFTGGGIDSIAVGYLNDNFLKLSKSLKRIQ